jgi:preprotein translocase subunit SecG
MAFLTGILIVLFVVTALLLIALVLVQNEEGDSLGGIFAGGSSTAFGSRSGNILSRASSVLGALFLVLSFGLALVNRTPDDKGVEAAGRRVGTEAEASDWWRDESAEEGDSTDADAPETGSPEIERSPVPEADALGTDAPDVSPAGETGPAE